MGFPQARLTDIHICTVPPPPAVPPVPTPAPIIGPCSPNTIVGKLPAARMGPDMALNGVMAPHPFVKGSPTVLINMMPALRVLDLCSLGGMIAKGEFTVLTGP